MKIEIDSEEYEALLNDRLLLNCLRMCGVDNWEGFSDAIDRYNEECENED